MSMVALLGVSLSEGTYKGNELRNTTALNCDTGSCLGRL